MKMISSNGRTFYKINVEIDITWKIEHWRDIKEKMGLIACIKTIRDAYPFLGLDTAKVIAEDI